jgi:hypothetical protein
MHPAGKHDELNEKIETEVSVFISEIESYYLSEFNFKSKNKQREICALKQQQHQTRRR